MNDYSVQPIEDFFSSGSFDYFGTIYAVRFSAESDNNGDIKSFQNIRLLRAHGDTRTYSSALPDIYDVDRDEILYPVIIAFIRKDCKENMKWITIVKDAFRSAQEE